MQYCVSKTKVINYCAEYATKSEPRSQPLKDVYKHVIKGLGDSDTSLKAVQKLLINSVGERDYSAQETSHLLLQLPLFMASRDFVVLSLDGSRALSDRLDDDHAATNLSSLDHYKARPDSPLFNSLTLLKFMQEYKVTKGDESRPTCRAKEVVVIVRPFLSPEPGGPKYKQYCKQKLMLHKPFRLENDLLENHLTFTEAFAVSFQQVMSPLLSQMMSTDWSTRLVSRVKITQL